MINMKESIFRPGHNCWKTNRAEHLSLLIDADNYYRAFFDVTSRAQNCIEITGWELDPYLYLSKVDRSMPDNFRQYLNDLTLKNKKLKIHVLVWKAFFYLRFGRERFTKMRWRLLTSSSLVYNSGRTPFFFASYHEKVVIVDDTCAFIGGMDLAQKRWDTSDHRPDNPLRKAEHGKAYSPAHDLQLVLSGDIAKDLKAVIHKREDADFQNNETNLSELWPKDYPPELENVDVAIMRTDPKEKAWEIKHFYEDAIVSAKEFILIENQHMTSKGLINLLCKRLCEEDGPEVIIITSLNYQGFFERAVYIDGRNKYLKELRKADIHGRLIVTFPSMVSQNGPKYITVHSKLLIVDNQLMSIGSANLNNRSMEVDNEINIGIEVQDDSNETEKFISTCVVRLLSEHLDTSREEFIKEYQNKGSLLQAILVFKGKKSKTLCDIPMMKISFGEKLVTIISSFIDIYYPISKRVLR
jgi:phospholipase D1/2